MNTKTSWVKRSSAMLAVAMVVCLAAIYSLDHVTPATADPIPPQNWSLDTTTVSTETGADVTMTITDPIIHDGRYVSVDTLTFPGKRNQTIDTGIIVRDELGAGTPFTIIANASSSSSGYLTSTSGVYLFGTTPSSTTPVFMPRYGLYYGYSSLVSGNMATRTMMATGNGTNLNSPIPHMALPLSGVITTTLRNQTGTSFSESLNIVPPSGQGQLQSTSNISAATGVLGDGTLLIGGVGGSCLDGNTSPATCQAAWDQDAGLRASGSNRASMFVGNITSVTITGGTGEQLLFKGTPAYDLMTGQCGLYDTVEARFITSQDPVNAPLTCATPTITVTSVDVPSLVFNYSRSSVHCTSIQAQAGHFCMTGVDGTLRLSVPPLPQGWVPGEHEFVLTITSGSVVKTITFTLVYMPPGTLTITKQAWVLDAESGEYEELVYDDSTDPPVIPVLPSGTSIKFTFTVVYEVRDVDGVADDSIFDGRPGLVDVVVEDDVLTTENPDPHTICEINHLWVNTPDVCTVYVELGA